MDVTIAVESPVVIAEVGTSVNIGKTYAFSLDSVSSDSGTQYFSVGKGPLSPMLGFSLRHGLAWGTEVGGEVYATLGTLGFGVYGKKALLPPRSKMGIALVPGVGVGFPWLHDEDDEEGEGFVSVELESPGFSTLVSSLCLPLSYRFHDQ